MRRSAPGIFTMAKLPAAISILLLAGCADMGSTPPYRESEDPGGVTDVTWKDVDPIFSANCRAPRCHGPARPSNGYSTTSRADVLSGFSVNGPVVVVGSSDDSFLIRTLFKTLRGRVTLVRKMPIDGPPLTPREIAVIADWIDQGARE